MRDFIYKVYTLDVKNNSYTLECPAWYFKEEDAINCIEQNICDIQDCCFNYAVIVKCRQGCYSFIHNEALKWYKWNYDGRAWEKCKCPEVCDNLMFV